MLPLCTHLKKHSHNFFDYYSNLFLCMPCIIFVILTVRKSHLFFIVYREQFVEFRDAFEIFDREYFQHIYILQALIKKNNCLSKPCLLFPSHFSFTLLGKRLQSKYFLKSGNILYRDGDGTIDTKELSTVLR